MRNANWTRILTILLALLALYALLAVVASIIQRFIVPLLLVILAAILAFILTPVVDIIQNRLHLFRWLSILITYLLVGCVLAALGFFLTSPLIAQTRSLADATKNPTHLENIVRVRSASEKLYGNARTYRALVGSDAQVCTAAAYMGELGSLNKSALGLPQCPNTSPEKPTIPQQLRVFKNKLVPTLLLASVRPTSKRTTKHHQSAAPIPTTKVPPSDAKPVHLAREVLSTAVHRAKADIRLRAGHYSADAARVLTAAHRLNARVRHLYSSIKSTPIIILALQSKIDQHRWPINLRQLFGKALTKVGSQGTTVLDNAVTILTSTISVIFDLFIIIVMSFYLLADGGRFIGWILGLVPESRREQAWFFIKSLNDVLGGYIRGQVIVAITIGVLAGTGSYFLGVPYALLIGIFAFLAESIPVIGPVLASIPAILVSLFTQPLLNTVLVIAWFIIVQQIEQNVVGPRITGHAVGIHPVVAMVAIIVGLEVGGFWGAFLAVPIMGLLQVVGRAGYNSLVRQQPLPSAAVPENVEVLEEDPVT